MLVFWAEEKSQWAELSYTFPTSRQVYCACGRGRSTHTACFPLSSIPIRTQQLQEILNAAPETIYHQHNQNTKWFPAEEWSCIKTLCTMCLLRGSGTGKNSIKGNKKYCCYGGNITHLNPPPVDLVQSHLFKKHFTNSFIRFIHIITLYWNTKVLSILSFWQFLEFNDY